MRYVWIAFLLFILFVITTPLVLAETTPTSIVDIADPLNGDGTCIQLDTGLVLFVELRVLETHGVQPLLGEMTNFSDQPRFLGMYVGWASFEQNNVTFSAYRSNKRCPVEVFS